jgi:hypothetical protein
MCEYGQMKTVFKEIGLFTLGKLVSVFASAAAHKLTTESNDVWKCPCERLRCSEVSNQHILNSTKWAEIKSKQSDMNIIDGYMSKK